MRSWGRHLCLLFALLAVAPAEHWDYHENGPSTWGETYSTCNGNLQSPVMLNIEDASRSPGWLLQLGDIDIKFHNYDSAATGVFSNNGHSVNLDFNFTNIITHPRVSISSPTASGVYYLQSLHFHWQSEHWIDHENYPLEMHMVHKDSTGEQILVIGYVFVPCERRLGRLFFSRSMAGMDEVAEAVEHLADVGDTMSFTLAPQRVMPSNLRACGYFAYTGSLTTPPCTEGVTWLVREAPMCVEERQLEAFYNVRDARNLPMAGNARPLQPINGRTVLFLTC
ncbi:hypothetical protein R5R35_011462 [Gryllus longicercus]|uniref:Carbonic anhydrase n=1 Tax=Gryllus longicercus TaxID=2509291 RepID=A0AAN9VI64_9ORTH